MFRRRKPTDDAKAATPRKQGRLAQLWAVFQMTRRSDPAVVWWMLLAFVGVVAVAFGVGLAIGQPVYLTVLGAPTGLMVALIIMARRAERAAYAQLAGRPGGSAAALQNLRRGWTVEEQPVAVDPRTQDVVFRAIGRPGVVLVTEGPVHRVSRMVEAERKRVTRVVPNVPVHVLHAGDEDGQVPLRKLSRTVTRLKPALTKTEVGQVTKRLRALGAAKMPIPKGIDPLRARPDRRATRGR
jgi:hypothetical protein